MFLLDLILSFFECYYDEDQNAQITSHKSIAKNYLKGWFTLDLISILPIEPILSIYIKKQTIRVNSVAKFARITRLYKLMRFVRLSKLMRLLKGQKKK